MSLREQVARALFAQAHPHIRWDDIPVDALENWGALADAAIAAVERYNRDAATP